MSVNTKKIEKSSSQGSGSGSVSTAAKERKKAAGKDKKSGGTPSISPTVSNVGVIKAPGGKKDAGAEGTSRRTVSGTSIASADKEKTEKGILKNKKSKSRSTDGKRTVVKAKAKPKVQKKSLMDKIAHSLGFHVGEVVLRDPWAIEAAQALDLQQWHLRKLKFRFDKIDLDGSGNIDYDEFFESIGEQRSPFTDKLFALIG